MFNREYPHIPNRITFALVGTMLAFSSLACILDGTALGYLKDSVLDQFLVSVKPVGEKVKEIGSDSGNSAAEGYLFDEPSTPVVSGEKYTNGESGELKPVGFVNYGEFDAIVRAQSYIPLGSSEAAAPPAASTVSSANDGVGDWPNASRFISVPMGAYSWCIQWEEGDLDEDGQIDIFHYIQNDPTVLDEMDSNELEFAEEVAIKAPPDAAVIHNGKCEVEDPTLDYIWVEVGVGDFIGSDVDSSEGPLPVDSKAGPGITAICWDNIAYIHFSEKAWCTYKSVSWEECLDGPYKGKMYMAVEK